MSFHDYAPAAVLAAPGMKTLLEMLPNDGAVRRFIDTVNGQEKEQQEEEEKD